MSATTGIARDAVRSDKDQLLELAYATGLFTKDEINELLGETLDGVFTGTLGPEHKARVLDLPAGAASGGERWPAGWTYCAPCDAGGLELFWIGVNPTVQNSGFGKTLLRDIENRVKAEGHSRLVICTSSAPSTNRAKAFYERNGYQRGADVAPDFYGPGEDKITFAKVFQ